MSGKWWNEVNLKKKSDLNQGPYVIPSNRLNLLPCENILLFHNIFFHWASLKKTDLFPISTFKTETLIQSNRHSFIVCSDPRQATQIK